MYLECRHVYPTGDSCHAAALKGSPWCYYHARFHERQRRLSRLHSKRDATTGRFLPAAQGSTPPQPLPAASYGVDTGTYDYGVLPVAERAPAPSDLPLELPPVEDSASVQLALMEVLQALARQELDPKRAGLLLYGLQVASSNAQNVRIRSGSIRELSYTDEGIPLAPEEYSMDVEDFNRLEDEEDAEDDDDDDEDSD